MIMIEGNIKLFRRVSSSNVHHENSSHLQKCTKIFHQEQVFGVTFVRGNMHASTKISFMLNRLLSILFWSRIIRMARTKTYNIQQRRSPYFSFSVRS